MIILNVTSLQLTNKYNDNDDVRQDLNISNLTNRNFSSIIHNVTRQDSKEQRTNI
jgi:hypothetical protein